MEREPIPLEQLQRRDTPWWHGSTRSADVPGMGRDRDPPRWLHSFGVAVTPGKSVTQGAGCPAQQNRPADQRIVATVEVREALGAETLIHFSIAAPTVESGDPDALDELGEVDAGRCTARFSAATRARVGDHIQINVTPEHLYFFDPKTHLAIRG